MTTGVKVGLQLPTVDGFGRGYIALPPLVRAAEEAGFDSVWFGDHLVANVPILESVVAASVAAAVSEHMQLGFGVMLAALRHPVWLAKQLSSLQVVSGGRVALGVGVGGEIAGEWDVAGVPKVERGRRTDTFLAALPRMMSGQTEVLGSPWNVTVPPLLPSAGEPELWIGGRSEAALRRAVRFGGGWMSLWMDETRLAASAAEMTAIAAASNRPRPPLGVEVMVYPTSDIESGERRVAEFMEAIYRIPYQKLSRYVLVDDVSGIVDRLAPLVGAGASTIVLIPALPDCSEHIDEFGTIAEALHRRFTDHAAITT